MVVKKGTLGAWEIHHIVIEQHAETFDLQQGKGLIKVNGQPISLVQPEILRFKVRSTSHNL